MPISSDTTGSYAPIPDAETSGQGTRLGSAADAGPPGSPPYELEPDSVEVEPHRGIMIMVLGIMSFFTVGIVLGPIAWIMGNTDMRKIRAGVMDKEGEGMTEAGRVCGMVATLLWLAAVGLVFAKIFCFWGLLLLIFMPR
jgi:hypothetical protein